MATLQSIEKEIHHTEILSLIDQWSSNMASLILNRDKSQLLVVARNPAIDRELHLKDV